MSITKYNQALADPYKEIAERLATIINTHLTNATSKIWHSHPVWFINENPIVGYSVQKNGLKLMFWSGQSFDEDMLNIKGEKFKDAAVFINDLSDIDEAALLRCLQKSQTIQWNYKNIVKRKGQ
jgi:hypothetical protein